MASNPSYNTKIRLLQGGDTLDVSPGGKFTADGAQAAHIATPTDLATSITAITAILVALENLGITASS